MGAYKVTEVGLHSFLTSTLDAGERLDSRHARLNPFQRHAVPTEYEAGWARDPAWSVWRAAISLAPAGNGNTIRRSSNPQPSSRTDHATLSRKNHTAFTRRLHNHDRSP